MKPPNSLKVYFLIKGVWGSLGSFRRGVPSVSSSRLRASAPAVLSVDHPGNLIVTLYTRVASGR